MVAFKPRFGYPSRSAASVSLNTAAPAVVRPPRSPQSSPSSTPPSTPPPHNPELYVFRLHCRSAIPETLEAIEAWFEYPSQTECFLLQFLRFHKGQVQPAALQLQSFWSFRTDRLGVTYPYPSATTFTHAVAAALASPGEMGGSFISVPGTTDVDGRAIVTMNMSRLVLSSADKTGILMARRVWTHLEKLLWSCTHLQLQTQGVCIILDTRNMGMLNGEKMTLEFLIDAIQNRFPIKMGALYVVHPPTWFSLMWPVVRRTMKAKLLQRVHILPSLDQLHTLIGKEHLPVEQGGLIARSVLA
ncbi:hypothetical protein H4R33_006249 [Dimargaris cristalligena]|uniref:CRAL-TRIO domain-containing protein n=1 Tax=Dimargaris cristalligena TaxID=215637 RepID=A0A4P9ZP58_9FUNG|nr:hypothetical protein H4R33_006249 [Dimargaris cristalligena]RKP35226.1 CRAL-TRIO domain-containing protein [Dimargaris cristalligena]|eukprot:RKP35226.1 CRAL-TRIO domain-containing protein [Dimargaris cristalligena]